MAELRALRADAAEIERVALLTARSLYGPEHRDLAAKAIVDGLRDATFMRPELCGVYVDDAGEIVASLQALDLEVQIGRAPVRTAGMIGLAVEPALWGRDCAQRLLDGGREAVQARGFALILGLGVPHYYERWGAAPVVADCQARIDARGVRGAPSRPFRPAGDADLELLAALFAEANRDRTGTVLRTASMWRGSCRKFDAIHAREDAYYGFDVTRDELKLLEVGARSRGATRDVLLSICAEARARSLRWVRAVVPFDHELLRAALPHGVDVQLRLRETGHWMARILDLHAFFEAIRPELERRLREAQAPSVALRARAGGETTALDLDGGGPGHVTLALDLPVRDWTQLAFGYRAPAEVLADHDLTVEPGAVRAAELLFPRGWAHVWPGPW